MILSSMQEFNVDSMILHMGSQTIIVEYLLLNLQNIWVFLMATKNNQKDISLLTD